MVGKRTKENNNSVQRITRYLHWLEPKSERRVGYSLITRIIQFYKMQTFEIQKFKEENPRVGTVPEWMGKIDVAEYEKLAGIGYQPKSIALYYKIPYAEFLMWFNMPFSPLAYHFKRGKLLQEAKEGMTMAADAASGQNATQALRWDKVRKSRSLSTNIDEICFPEMVMEV